MAPVNKLRELSHNFSLELLVKITFVAGIILLPLISWKIGWSLRYEVPKVFVFNRWVELLALLTIILQIRRPKKKKFDTKLLALVILFVTNAVVASILGPDLNKSILGNYYRGQGLFTLFHLVSLSVIITLIWDRTWIKILAYSFVTSSIIVSLQTIILGFNYHILMQAVASAWSGSISSSFGQPNFLAGYLVVTLPFTLYLFIKAGKNYKLVYLFITMIQIVAIILTQSVAGTFGVILVTLGTLFIYSSVKQKKLLALSWLIITILGVVMFIANNRYSQSNLTYEPVRAGSRERIVRKALFAIKEKPILGWGWSNFDYAFDSTDWPLKFEHDVYVDKAHSNILEVVVTTGTVGLLLYLGIIIRTGYVLTKSNSKFYKILLLTLVIFVIHSQTNIISIAEETIFWVIVGVSISIAPKLLRR